MAAIKEECVKNVIVPVLSLCFVGPALADVALLTQARSVHAMWTGGDLTVSAPDFAPFTASVGEIIFSPNGNSARAAQDSTIAPDRFDFAGTVEAFHNVTLAESLYEVGFRVDSPQTFALDASVLQPNFFGSGTLRAQLVGPGGELFNDIAYHIAGFDQQIHRAGDLPIGNYTLFIRYATTGVSTSVVTGGDGVAVMMFTPVPLCAADFDHDGVANSADFFAFLQAFFGQLPTADVNADTVVDSQDFFAFIVAFFAGC